MRVDAATTVLDRAGMGAIRTPDHSVENDKALAEMSVAGLDPVIRQYQMDLNVLRATDGELVTDTS